MKVVAVEAVVVGTPWRELTFVELVTDDGLRGVGEARMVNQVVAEYRAARTRRLRPDPSTNAQPGPRP